MAAWPLYVATTIMGKCISQLFLEWGKGLFLAYDVEATVTVLHYINNFSLQ